jgi:anti-sigma regulatory factor (Ser/Thr protein kinase)
MLGDFTGHGLNAAIGAMPLAQTFYEMLEKGFLLRDILDGVNLKLFEVLPTDLFCCAIFVEINYREGSLHVWNGGLPDCQLLRASTGECVALPSTHLPLGVRPEHQFDSRLEAYDVSPGDRLLLWTDGIFEIMDEKGNMFGSSELEHIVNLNSMSGSLFSEINQAAASFKGEAAALDDISLIEITMVESWECQYQGPVFMGTELGGGGDWSLSYELRPDSLRNINPLPQLLYILMETPSLRAHGGRIYTVLSELFTNALEHGLLGLDSSSKETEKGFDDYYQERDKRLADLQLGSIILSLDYQGGDNNARLVVNVEDTGKGFDFRPGLLGGRQHNDYSGRGISLIEGLCDSIEYSGSGNTVEAVFSWRG